MNREEAIQICKEVRHCLWIADEQKTTTIWDKGAVSEAMLMAIEALKRETHDGCDGCMYEHYEELTEPCASCKQNYMDRYIPMPKHDRDWIVGCIKHDGFIKTDRGDKANQIILEALKADRPTDGDLISRAEAIEAIQNTDWYHQNQNKDMVHGANDDEHQAWYKADDVYKALEAVPSADRPRGEQYKKGFEDAKRAFLVEYARESQNMRKRIAQLEVMLNAQKAISADRPRGEWKQIEINGYPYAVCDQCHLLADIVEKDGELVMSMANADEKCANFCPNCGADMRERSE